MIIFGHSFIFVIIFLATCICTLAHKWGLIFLVQVIHRSKSCKNEINDSEEILKSQCNFWNIWMTVIIIQCLWKWHLIAQVRTAGSFLWAQRGVAAILEGVIIYVSVQVSPRSLTQ